MSGGANAHALYRHGDSPLHRLAPQCKLAAQFLFVLAVVATPREALWAYGVYALVMLTLVRVARVPLPFIARRLAIETPFVLFAVFLPLIGRGERIDVLGLSLSRDGLWAAWNIVVKATLGLSATILVMSTTTVSDVLRGLERLHVPRAFTSVASFMIRYLDVITGEVQRMKVARESRGYDPRWLWQAKAIAASAGALFIRSFERGERVYLAMVSRGYAGSMPVLTGDAVPVSAWLAALSVPFVAAAVSTAAWVVR